MGAGASASQDFSSEDKMEIARTLQTKYEDLVKDNKTGQEAEVYEALKKTYQEVNKKLADKRKNPRSGENRSTKEQPSQSNVGDLPAGSSTDSGDSDTLDQDGDTYSENMPKIEGQQRFLLGKTSSQLLTLVEENGLDDAERVAQFISQLKTGEVLTRQSSEFRSRRLSYSQTTVENAATAAQKHEHKPKKVSTVIFASTEIGVKQERGAPFPSDTLGTYSCHGIEPSYDSYNGGVTEKINQDRGCIVYPFNSKRDEALFSVLDGHGEQGDRVSEFVMRQLVVSLEKEPNLDSDPLGALKNTYTATNTALMATGIQYITSGCTCVTVYVKGSRLHIANVGDSRAVLGWIDGNNKYVARDLSTDHKPDDPLEKARITAAGGFVCPPREVGLSARVYLDPHFTMIGLAMSRSIGDHAVKAVGVTADPEVSTYDLQPHDKFMIMASDGVWEFISSQEAVDVVSKNLHKGTPAACQELIELAALRWHQEEGDYRDDITAIVVHFPLPFTHN